MTDHEIRIRTLERQNRKLQERLNRISNAMIGNARIWILGRLAIDSDMEANIIDQSCIENLASRHEVDIWSSDERADKHEQAKGFRADALFLRRLEHDLGTLHVAVRGDTNRRGSRHDQSNWKGPRP